MKKVLLLMLPFLLVACNKLFDYHPYDVHFSGECDINAKNIVKIENACKDKDTLKFAFISDTHNWYTETKAMVENINKRGDVDFVIHGGDLTDCATTKEFVWQRDILACLNMPYVALIGNHDFLGTGDEVYAKMYGKTDFSFIVSDVKIICLNTNATEYDYLAAVPNFDFLEEEYLADSAKFDRTIMCMHARPYDDQFNNNVARSFEHYVTSFPGLMFCVNGHEHQLLVEDIYKDGVIYYGADCAQHRSYLLFTITKDNYEYKVINF
jgi:predicted phosphodiesterase